MYLKIFRAAYQEQKYGTKQTLLIYSYIYKNYAENDILIKECSEFEGGLFNFNHTLYAEKLCLSYRTKIENAIGRDIFYVHQFSESEEAPFSLVFSDWFEVGGDVAPSLNVDSIARNHFNISTKGLSIDQIAEEYLRQDGVSVNFYHWNNYQVDKKFYSYGELGETEVFIGKNYIDKNLGQEVNSFNGKMPEYITFPYQLNGNEKNRVASYLALKYGLTLSEKVSYKSARNITFWNKKNNNKFSKRIFGMGRDNISGLQQYQSNSMENEGKLIASLWEKYKPTNNELINHHSLEDEHFLVFADNNDSEELTTQNNKGVQCIGRIWLSQSTGRQMNNIPTHFSYKSDYLLTMLSEHNSDPNNRSNPWVVWMLHDPQASNDKYSDFNSDYINYYRYYSISSSSFLFGEKLLSNLVPSGEPLIFFDQDKNKYDQFTFGLGPEIILQFHHAGCDPEKGFETEVIVNGGEGPYQVKVTDCNGNNLLNYQLGQGSYTVSSFLLSDMEIMTFPDCEYEVSITDANGVQASSSFKIESYPMGIDLGGMITLDSNQPSVTLKGNEYVEDPEATYTWYFNEELMDDNSPAITVNTPGEYTLEITNGDRTCTISDTVLVENGFECFIDFIPRCEPNEQADLTIDIEGGFQVYHTNIKSIDSGFDYSVAHNTSTIIPDIPIGNYVITVTDNLGKVCSQEIEITCFHEPAARNTSNEEALPFGREEEVTQTTPKNFLQTKIYPNPSSPSSHFYYEISSSEVIRGAVEIFSTSGALIKRKKINSGSSQTLNFQLISSGLYFIKLSTPQGVKVDKVIIK